MTENSHGKKAPLNKWTCIRKLRVTRVSMTSRIHSINTSNANKLTQLNTKKRMSCWHPLFNLKINNEIRKNHHHKIQMRTRDFKNYMRRMKPSRLNEADEEFNKMLKEILDFEDESESTSDDSAKKKTDGVGANNNYDDDDELNDGLNEDELFEDDDQEDDSTDEKMSDEKLKIEALKISTNIAKLMSGVTTEDVVNMAGIVADFIRNHEVSASAAETKSDSETTENDDTMDFTLDDLDTDANDEDSEGIADEDSQDKDEDEENSADGKEDNEDNEDKSADTDSSTGDKDSDTIDFDL